MEQVIYSFHTRDYSQFDLTASPHRIEYWWDEDAQSGYAWDVHAQQRRGTFASRAQLDAAIDEREDEFAERDYMLEIQRLQAQEGLGILDAMAQAKRNLGIEA